MSDGDGVMTAKELPDFWVVGIGASAGGLEALSTFFRSLPEDCQQACFLVAQHLAPHSKSMMVELIARQTPLPVVAVEDDSELEVGKIFIVPPNFDLSLVEGRLHLAPAGPATRPKPSVDTFFLSLGQTFGARAVGIILSGTGSDGAQGVREIKAYGGSVFVQTSESAKYDGMPKSAFGTGLVDAILPVEELGARLFDLLDNLHSDAGKKSTIGKREFSEILEKLRDGAGFDFTQYKPATIVRRIEKRMGVLGITERSQYIERLGKDADEVVTLSQEMLISVTSFFRDADHFDALRDRCRARLLKDSFQGEFRVWVAGCATGEEAYSLLMLLDDVVSSLGKQNVISIKIFATDIDQNALTIARLAHYPASSVERLPTDFIERYFDNLGDTFEVKKRYRDCVVFAKQDLVQNPPFVRVDLVSCRNVLIYFDAKLQEKVLGLFQYALRSDGLLFLGKSEAVHSDIFTLLDKRHKIFERGAALTRATPSYTSPARRLTPIPSHTQKQKATELFEIGALQILKASGYAGAIITDTSEVQHFIGDLTRFVDLPGGRPDFRLSSLMGSRGGIELGLLLKRVTATQSVSRSRFHMARGGSNAKFSFTVSPFEAPAGMGAGTFRKLFLVTFEPRPESKKLKSAKSGVKMEKPVSISSESDAHRIIELEHEVAASREHLQTVIEELEVSNEELQSLNEEMSSTNEELQSSNEELETTNEELQSTNEELTTLNEEITTKSAELRVANLNLENVQTSIGSPLLVVDADLRLVRHNALANQIFHLTATDINRPLLLASAQCEIPKFETSLREAIDSGTSQESLCTSGKRIYQLRIHPFRDETKRITGAVLIFFDNTDMIVMQDRLKTSDTRIRSIINGSPTLISLKDTSGRYLTVNQAFLSRFNLSEESVIGKTDREVFDVETSTRFHDRDLEVVLRRQSIESQETIRVGSETRQLLSSRFALLSDSDGSPFAIGTVSLDITAQIHAQDELRRSQARYRAIVEDQAVFVARASPTGNLTFSNQAFCSYFGGTPESNEAKTFLSIVDRRDTKKLSAEIALLSQELPIVQVELRVNPVSSGPVRWVRWILRGIFDESGSVHEYQAVGFDVTEVHNRTADLLEKENLFTHVLEHTSDYLSVFRVENADFILESFNQSAGQTKGLGHSRFVGRPLQEFLDPSRAESVLRRYRESVQSRSSVTFEEAVEVPGGLRHLSTTLVPVGDPHNNAVKIVALSRDITRMKRVETALREEKEKADRANQTKSDFLASMSHELRTPLNVITGMSQLLAMAKLAPEHVKLVTSIQRSSKTLLALIEDVLDLSKIEAGKISLDARPFSLQQLCLELVQSFEVQARDRGNVLILNDKLDNLSEAAGDPTRLRQIIANLVSNAIKFTQNGSVTIDVSNRASGIPGTQIVHIEVTDTGIGIPEASRPKLFQRFSQVDSGISRKYGGTGLGLVISKQLVELMGGEIGVESVAGVGSTFWFTVCLSQTNAALTRALARSPESTTTPGDLPKVDLHKLTLLAVDDNPENLSALKMYLEDQGAKVVTAESGREAIELVKTKAIHMVLMDVQMPGMDGLEATRTIRALSSIKSDIPIVAITANAMSEDPVRCREAGMDDYISKPIDFDVLARVIQTHAKWGATNVPDLPSLSPDPKGLEHD